VMNILRCRCMITPPVRDLLVELSWIPACRKSPDTPADRFASRRQDKPFAAGDLPLSGGAGSSGKQDPASGHIAINVLMDDHDHPFQRPRIECSRAMALRSSAWANRLRLYVAIPNLPS